MCIRDRSYKELKEKLKFEKIVDMKDLPCYEDSAEINNNSEYYAVSYTHLDVYKRQK